MSNDGLKLTAKVEQMDTSPCVGIGLYDGDRRIAWTNTTVPYADAILALLNGGGKFFPKPEPTHAEAFLPERGDPDAE